MIGSTSGRILIGGTAAMLLCLFLSPRFIDFLRNREFGQHVREEGPEAHKLTKAGTPTMGGIIILLAFSIPFLILSTRDWLSMGVFGVTVACAVLGDMLELGPAELEYHGEIGECAAATGVDVLVTVGPLAAAIAERFDGEAYSVADAGEAAALVGELIEPGDVVLVKGSRGVGLELVCQALTALDSEDAP